jgi:hypothetical protein
LNLRPPGYEPGELPDCSTPRRGPDCSTLVTIVPMSDWAIWGALIAVVAACAAASVLLFTRARTAWRDAREAGRDVIGRLDRLQASGEEAAEKLAALEGPTEELQQSLDRLRISLARLAVLRSALDEAQVAFGRVAAVVPHR